MTTIVMLITHARTERLLFIGRLWATQTDVLLNADCCMSQNLKHVALCYENAYKYSIYIM